MRLAVAPADLTEKQLTGQVVDLAKSLSWLRYHTFRSEKSPAGFPDEVLVRERVVYLELKNAKRKLTPEQADWLLALLDAGAEAYLIRPRHLEALAKVLACRAPHREWPKGPPLEVALDLTEETRAEAERHRTAA